MSTVSAEANAHATPSAIWPLAAVVFTDAIGLGLLVPMLAYFVQAMGARPAVITQLVAIYAFAAFVGAPLLGAISDRVPRRLVVVGCMAGLAVAYIGMAFAPSLAVLFAFRALSGLMAGNESVAQAIVTQGVAPDLQMKRIGIVGASRGVGMILGPVLGGIGAIFISDPQLYYRGTLISAAVLSGLAMVLTWLFVEEGARAPAARGKRPSFVELLASDSGRQIAGLFLLTAAISFGFGVFQSITALYVQKLYGWGATQTGALLGLCAAVIVVARLYLARQTAQKLGFERALAASVVLAFASMAILTAVLPAWAFSTLYASFCLAYGLSLVLTTSGVASKAPADHRGAYLGTNQAFFALAVVISAVINGPAFDFVAPNAPYVLAAAVLALASAGCCLALLRRETSPKK